MPLIVQVAYEASLLKTRERLLSANGFDVKSALGSKELKQIPREHFLAAAALLVGHATDTEEREHIVSWAKQNYPDLPVVALRKSTTSEPIRGADVTADREDPSQWLEAIKKVAASSACIVVGKVAALAAPALSQLLRT